jgi:hypothetical protein
MLEPAAVAYVFPFKLYVGPALVIALAACLVLLVRFPALKGKVGAVLVVFGFTGAYGCLILMFGEGVIIGLSTVVAGVALELSALQPKRAVLLTRRRRFPLKAVAAVVLLVTGACAVFAGFPLASFALVVSGLAALVIGSVLGVGVLASHVTFQLRLKEPAKLRKTAYAVLTVVILVSAVVMSLRATNTLHEQRLQTWHISAVNLTVQGNVTDLKLNYEVNNGYFYHIFPAYVTLGVTRVLWVGPAEFSGNLTNVVDYWSNRTVLVACDKLAPQGLAAGQQVEVNGCYLGWLEDSVYSGMLVVAPNMNESYLTPL